MLAHNHINGDLEPSEEDIDVFSAIFCLGSIVNMGIKNENREICYIIGVLKSIRQKLGKKDGDEIEVEIEVIDW